MASCLLCDWGLCLHSPISTVLCPNGSYACLGAWDTIIVFERLSLVPLRINNAEIHVWKLDGGLSESPQTCLQLSFWLICTPSWRDTTLQTASHCRYTSEGKCFEFQRYTKYNWTEVNPIFLKPYPKMGKWDPSSSEIVPSNWPVCL